MSYNRKALSKAKLDLDKYKKPNPYKKDILYTQEGQWKYPGQKTRIPSSDITMQGVPFPVFAQPNVGQPQMMYPGQEYSFPGASYVDEYPQMKKGGLVQMPKPSKKGLASKKYSRSLFATNKLFTENPLFKKPKSKKRKVFDPNAKYYQDGGITLPNDYIKFKTFTETLPSNLQDPNFEYGNPDQYNLYGMWETVGKPNSFAEVQDSEYFPLQDDGTYYGFTVGSDGEFLKPMSHGTTWKEVMNAHLNTDPYFQQNRIIKNEKGRLQYIPNNEDDYIELDLSPEEIEQYAKGGYVVEELPEMQPGGPFKPGTGYKMPALSKSEIAAIKKEISKAKPVAAKSTTTVKKPNSSKQVNKSKEDAAYEKFLDQNLGKEGSNTYTYVDPRTGKTEQREYSNAHLKDNGNISVDEATWNTNRDRQNMQHLSEALSGVGEITGINSAIRTGERLIDDPLKFAGDLTTGISQAPETLVEGAMTLGSKLFGDNKDYVDVDTDALGVALDVAGALPVFGVAGKAAKPVLKTGLKYSDDVLNSLKGYRASQPSYLKTLAKEKGVKLKSKTIDKYAENLPESLIKRRLDEITNSKLKKRSIYSEKELEKKLKIDQYRVNKLKKQYPELDFNNPEISGYLFTNKEDIEKIPGILKSINQNKKSGESFAKYIKKDFDTKMDFIKNSDNKVLMNVVDESPQYLDEVYEHLRAPKTTDENFLNDLTLKSNTYTRFMKDDLSDLEYLNSLRGKNIDNSGFSMDVEGVSPSDFYGKYGYKVQPDTHRIMEIISTPLEKKWSKRIPTFENDVTMMPGMHTGRPSKVEQALRTRNERMNRLLLNAYEGEEMRNFIPTESFFNSTIKENLPKEFVESKYYTVPKHQVFNSRKYAQNLERFRITPLGKLEFPKNNKGYKYNEDYERFFEGTGKGFQEGGNINKMSKGGLNSPKDLDPVTLEKYLSDLRGLENSIKKGYKNNKWYPHSSIEGGANTIAYGHKLQPGESFSSGLTEQQARDLQKKDVLAHQTKAEKFVDDKYGKGTYDKLPQNSQMLLTDYAYNLGSLNKFPSFVEGVVKGDKNKMLQQYERRGLNERNKWTKDVINTTDFSKDSDYGFNWMFDLDGWWNKQDGGPIDNSKYNSESYKKYQEYQQEYDRKIQELENAKKQNPELEAKYTAMQQKLKAEQSRVDKVRSNVIPTAKRIDAADDKIVSKYFDEQDDGYYIKENTPVYNYYAAENPTELKKAIANLPQDVKNVLPGKGQYNIAKWEGNEWNSELNPNRELYCTPYGCFAYQEAGASDVPTIAGNVAFADKANKGDIPFEKINAKDRQPGDIGLLVENAPVDYSRPELGERRRPHHTAIYATPGENVNNPEEGNFYNAYDGSRFQFGQDYFNTNKSKDDRIDYYRYVGQTPKLKKQLSELEKQRNVQSENIKKIKSEIPAPYLPTLAANKIINNNTAPLEFPLMIESKGQSNKKSKKQNTTSYPNIFANYNFGGSIELKIKNDKDLKRLIDQGYIIEEL